MATQCVSSTIRRGDHAYRVDAIKAYFLRKMTRLLEHSGCHNQRHRLCFSIMTKYC